MTILCHNSLAARNFAISSKKSLWHPKKNDILGANVSKSNPEFIAESAYSIAFDNVNATSSTATNDSFNVSSVGDNGTGNQTHNHTNAFRANKAYTTGGAAANASDVTTTSYQIQPLQDDTVLTTSVQIVNIYNTDTASGVSDYAYLSLSCHGDLA